jgi:hypothetical protein
VRESAELTERIALDRLGENTVKRVQSWLEVGLAPVTVDAVKGIDSVFENASVELLSNMSSYREFWECASSSPPVFDPRNCTELFVMLERPAEGWATGI